MKLTLRQLQQVVVLAEHGHFGRAAEALHVSQPALSRGIQTLEDKLGTPLFTRSPAGAVLTESGRILVERARAILADCDDLERRVDSRVTNASQRLRVAAGHYPSELGVVDVVAAMMREDPRVSVSLQCLDWLRCIDLLASRQVDVAVCEVGGLPDGAGLRFDMLGRHRVYFLVRTGHPLAAEQPVSLDAALAFPWACSPMPARAMREFGSARVAAGAVDATRGIFMPAIHATSQPLSLRLAAQSDAVAIAPLTVAEHWIENGILVALAYGADWFRLNYGFVWSERRPPVGAVARFKERLEQRERQVTERESELRRRFGLAV